MKRAYSFLTIKSVDADKRRFSGIASTPTVDRIGDIVEPKGAEFKLPLPLLWQHNSRDPIGWVTMAKVTNEGIEVEGEIAKVENGSALDVRLSEAWQYIKSGLVRGLSIGFSSIEEEPIKNSWGLRFTKWLWLELSAVTIPANGDAQILAVKSLARKELAALGRELPDPPPAAAPPPGATGKSTHAARRGTMNLSEQIAGLKKVRDQKAAQMAAIAKKASDEGRNFDATEGEEFDTLKSEVDGAEKDLKRLDDLEQIQIRTATSVSAAAGSDADAASRARGGNGGSASLPRISVRSNLPQGTGFIRYAMALANAKGNLPMAVEMSKRWRDSTPEVEEVLKAAVAAGTTTDSAWASPLVVYTNLVSEFIELLRPATIIGRLPSLRRIPFNVRMPKQTGGGTYGWVGEGAPKPVGKLQFSEVTLRWAKAAGIIVISEELARLSNPAAEAIVRADMVAGVAQFLDGQFVDPAVAEVANVSPASITNGITAIESVGNTADNVRTDVGSMMAAILAANIVPTSGAWIMNNVTAMRLSMMMNSLGQPEFPGVIPTGGTFLGYPVVTSESVPAGSAGALVIFVNQPDIFLAEEGLVIDVSNQASLQMDTAPTNPPTASTVFTSLWQMNMIGIRAERFINWKRRRDQAVGYIEGVNWGE